MIRIEQVSLKLNEDTKEIPNKIAAKLDIAPKDILLWNIAKESIDARKKKDIKLIYTIDMKLSEGMEQKLLSERSDISKPPDKVYIRPDSGTARLTSRPVVAGFGPCGMFAALMLSEMGYRPIVLERGGMVDQRVADAEEFWKSGKLNLNSNSIFGEGGAGTFSDGKLTTQIKDVRIRKVLETLVEAGAPQEILYKQKPHIGTDLLRDVVKEIRKRIIELGGEFYFGCRLEGFQADSNRRLESVYCRQVSGNVSSLPNSAGHAPVNESCSGDEKECGIKTNALILALGHSARDTIEKLYDLGIVMEQKPFSIGMRIEHLQQVINKTQFGSQTGDSKLGAAEYKLSYHTGDGRGVYTFCMCPGGFVIAATSEEGMVVTNGMSRHARGGRNANSALLVDVRKEDFGSSHPLAGMAFQREWERKTFLLGGGDYSAPVQRLGDFMTGIKIKKGSAVKVKPTYRPGVRWSDLSKCLPAFAVDALREAIPVFGRKLTGFDSSDAVLTAIESRSSSPVRIIRDENFESNISGIYPAGEGAGYSGGIISSAVDGIKAAEKIIAAYAPFEL